jgi:hypothetical protein
MSLDVHRLVMQQFEKVLNQNRYWSKKQLEKRSGTKGRRCHGFDESKFNAASLFYLPSQAKDPKDSFFLDYAEDDPKCGPLDVHEWIDHCILSLRPDPEPVRLASEPVAPVMPVVLFEDADNDNVDGVIHRREGHPNLEEVRRTLLAQKAESLAGRRAEKVAKAVTEWRGTPPGMGHNGFFKLGTALRGAGLDEFEIRMKLQEEALYANSPKKRRGEINGILKSLRHSGTFSRRAA